MGNVCVNEEQLKELLEKAGRSTTQNSNLKTQNHSLKVKSEELNNNQEPRTQFQEPNNDQVPSTKNQTQEENIETYLDSYPEKETTSTNAEFVFHSNIENPTYQC